MNQQPDKLFRDKLKNYQPAAPASAWDRIAAAQGKKKSNKGWLKIAASLLLVAGAGAVWVLTMPGAPPAQVAGTQALAPDARHNSKPDEASAVTAPSSIVPSSSEASSTVPSSVQHPTTSLQKANDEKLASAATHQRQKKSTSTGNADNKASTKANGAVPDKEIVIMPMIEDQSNGVATRQSDENESIANMASKTNVADAAGSISKNVTLTYSTADVSAYLNKNTEDEATEDERKQSTLKKLLQKANDLKTNQDPFGELRQRKNEILALNFMNDKRGQKTRN